MLWVTEEWEGYREIIVHEEHWFGDEDTIVPVGVFVECFDGVNVLGIADPISTTDEGSWEDLFPNRAEYWHEAVARYVIRNAEERDRLVAALNAMEFE